MADFEIYQQEIIYLIRISIAGICGLLIGLERQNRSKEAGVRTHFVVACAAALIMVVSKYAFFDLVTNESYILRGLKLDPSRIASSIVSGIGFLGAGMIFVHKNTVTGLTTAAGIWATAGIGMAIGSGMYITGLATTFIIIIAQIILHFNFRWNRSLITKRISIKDVDQENYEKSIKEILNKYSVNILQTSVEKNNDTNFKNYVFTLEVPEKFDDDKILSLINYKCSIKDE